MSRLTWGAPAERYYETGVDRGVLYVGVDPGVAWNGLVSVSESPTGGEAKPAYIDGYKFRNLASAEEFEASIEAFSAPKEFGPCDGTASVQNGLFLTQQPRKAFGFSYRTLVGDAVGGSEANYKIHIVYNALAAPSERSNNTMSDSVEAATRSWSITTRSPMLSSHKPTAHFVIDSRYTPRGLLAAIEDILYGSLAYAPRLPLVSELMTMFQSEGPVTRINLLTDPRLTVAMTSNNGAIWTTTVDATHTFQGTSATKSTKVAGAASGDVVLSGYKNAGALNGIQIAANAPVTVSMYVYTETAGRHARARVTWWNDTPTYVSDVYGDFVSLEPGVWTRVSSTGIRPANATSVLPMCLVQNESSGVVIPDNESAWTACWMVEVAGVLLPYFDGSTLDADLNFYSWEGVANASVSRLNTWN